MMFTILDDQHQSLVCNDCLDDELLELAYSECAAGTCDECGYTDLGALGGNGAGLLVLCLTLERGSAWALNHGCPNAKLIPTNEDSGRSGLEGRLLSPGLVVFLPEAERGKHFEIIEQQAQMHTSKRNAVNINVTANMSALQQQLAAQTVSAQKLQDATISTTMSLNAYKHLMYGIDPGVGTGVAVVSGVTT